MCEVEEDNFAKVFLVLSFFIGKCCLAMEGNSDILAFRRKLEPDVLSSSTKRRISKLDAIREQLSKDG
jgi:hypothetical protein